MRLVPDQDHDEIAMLFENYVKSLAIPGIKVKVTNIVGNKPLIVPRDSPSMDATARAIEYAFGRKPVFIREGGSIGAVLAMKLGLDVDDILMLGWGDPGDALHSPNEHFSLDNFRKGTVAVAALLYELSKVKKPVKPLPISQ